MVELGVDMLVVQGGEGGGHTGLGREHGAAARRCSTRSRCRSSPPAASRTDAGFAAALAYGAHGIAMGTRFLMTRDCPVPDATKKRYTRRDAPTTSCVTTKVDGMPQRMIRNEALGRLERAGRLRMLRARDLERAQLEDASPERSVG